MHRSKPPCVFQDSLLLDLLEKSLGVSIAISDSSPSLLLHSSIQRNRCWQHGSACCSLTPAMKPLIFRVHAANHGRRVTVMPKDHRLVREIITIYDPASFLGIPVYDRAADNDKIQQLPGKGKRKRKRPEDDDPPPPPPPPPPGPRHPSTGGKAPRKTTGGKAPRKTVPSSTNTRPGGGRGRQSNNRTKQTAAKSTDGKAPDVRRKLADKANRRR